MGRPKSVSHNLLASDTMMYLCTSVKLHFIAYPSVTELKYSHKFWSRRTLVMGNIERYRM